MSKALTTSRLIYGRTYTDIFSIRIWTEVPPRSHAPDSLSRYAPTEDDRGEDAQLSATR